ncbi:alpha/beta hydrolase [Celeribacter sp. PS-C1]|uniref:alpha/beta hydrolase n=1 Tax=Celeribacter sp. PS-C1 TaxID=2820813 RepID=UPI001C66ED4B|nr:alpha/beta hydrolase [Celeribacter sp. PS-C1]MBW6417488.1 alpha/beta hydrolase [Celeribacter sp. PS-C1]
MPNQIRPQHSALTRRHLMMSALAVAYPWPVRAADKPETISYGVESLDIYRAVAPRGAVIYVHGGAWRRGSRKAVDAKPDWFNSMNLDFVSIDYPMLPKTHVTDQIKAVRQAIDWCFANIATPERTVVIGHSAGAHLVAMAALTGWMPQPAGVIVNDSGAVDLITLARAHQGQLPFGTSNAFKDRDQWGALSPAYNLAKTLPPILAITSQAHGHGMAMSNFVTNARANDADATLFDGSDYRHAEVNRTLGTGKIPDLERAVTGFITKVLQR